MVNDSTREYSVYVSDLNNTVSGSGLLFYAGGDVMFVFTCAHVVDDLEVVRLHILKEIDSKRDLYDVIIVNVPSSQIITSPMDCVTGDKSGNKNHSEDLAIIYFRKPDDFYLDKTRFLLAETSRNSSVYVQGYANGVPDDKRPISYLETLHGNVIASPADENQFTIRLDAPYINTSNRVAELEGLSGAPVWDDEEEVNIFLGVFTSAYDSNATLGKTHVTKALRLRSIMYEYFEILIERKLDGIPDDDIAGSKEYEPLVFDGKINVELPKHDYDKWIEEELVALRITIDDLKLQNAIDKGRELITDSRYQLLSIDSKRKVKQYLLYCYEIADMDDEFEDIEEGMRIEGLIKDHDTLRWLTRSFMKKDYQETIKAARHTIDNWDESSKVSLLSFAQLFLLMSRSYTEEMSVDDVMGQILDEHENFILPLSEPKDVGLAYQMIGFIYGDRYKDYVNSIRFLNRSYRVGYDSIILESLGAAYYFLSIDKANDESDHISDVSLIDRKSLYKARECFLNVLGKADRLFWAGTMRRVGLCVYNTFVFLPDNYRVLTIYPDVKEYVKTIDNIDEADFWRDIEMKYAIVVAQSSIIDVSRYPNIRRMDRILLETVAKTAECSNIIEQAMAELTLDQIRNSGLDRYIRQAISETENNVRVIDRKNRFPIYVQLMNMYGRGMHLFGWDKRYKLDYCLERIRGHVKPEQIELLENFIYEFDAPLDDVIQRFKNTFENRRNINTWQELNRLYIRHRMMDKADEMYTDLLAKRKELIIDEPEYAYRAFMDYVIKYKRDLKYALKCYIDAKETFQDTDIKGFWELELMIYSNSFNDPERFEIERKPFLEKGLITEEQFHRTAFIAYLSNLNEEKAREHFEYVRSYPHFINHQNGMLILHQSEIHFLHWIGEIEPNFQPPYYSMLPERAIEIRKAYRSERWHREIDNQLCNLLMVDRNIAIDAWALYQLAIMDKLDLFEEMDSIYVSHMSIIRLHEEYSRTHDQTIKELQDYLINSHAVKILSGGFKAQLEVRNVIEQYYEPASTFATAIETDSIVVSGDPELDVELINHFGNRIIRVNDFIEIFQNVRWSY